MGYVQDPFTTDAYRYECPGCGARTRADQPLGSCPDCGGSVRNIAVPRE